MNGIVLWQWLTVGRRRVLYACGAAILLFVIGNLLRPGFASLDSIEAVLVVASFVGLVAAGQTFVILIGGIDLSVPWILNAAAILFVTSSLGENIRTPYALLLTLGMGALAGMVNGLGIAVLGVPAVVMTLAMNGIMQGLTLGLSSGLTCDACASYAPPLIQQAVHDRLLGVPMALYLWLAVILLVSFVLSFTVFGRTTYAVGTNPRASYLAGLNVSAITITLYSLSGLFSALAGIMLVGFGGQASLGMGDPYLFQRGSRYRRRVYPWWSRQLCRRGRGCRDAGDAGQRAADDEYAGIWQEHHLRGDYPAAAALWARRGWKLAPLNRLAICQEWQSTHKSRRPARDSGAAVASIICESLSN